jgi:hypothetical protein
METKVSYGARFFTKFVEIIAAGLATAVSAYLIAQLGGLLNSVAPAPAVVQTVATVGDGGKSPARTVAPIAASAIDDQHAAPQPEADASAVPAARKASRPGHDVPARKDNKPDSKTGTSMARGDRSVEALARAALAKVDADQPAPAQAPPAQARPAQAPPREADPLPPLVAVQVPAQAPVQAPAQAAIQIDTQPVAAIAPPPSAPVPPEAQASAPALPPIQHRGLFAVLKQMPNLLRPDPPAAVGEAIRPPMPIGTAGQD